LNITNFTFDIVAFKSIENIGLDENSSNLKSLIIVLDMTTLTKESDLLLSKILNAVDHQYPEHTLLLDTSSFKQIRILDVFDKTGLNKLLSFGITPIDIGINLSPRLYTNFDLLGYKFLFSESLDILAENANSKKLLWNGLKQFFELNPTNA